jgi:adenine-specific DNA-methyltransferase
MNFIKNETPTKLRGGYYTDPDIASFLTRWVFEIAPKRLLEPSCGDGVFIDAINRTGQSSSILAIERDRQEAEKAVQRARGLKHTETRVIAEDFLKWGLFNIGQPLNFDAALGNPPFVRYQYLENTQQLLMEKVFQVFHLHFTMHTNAWVPFVILSVAHLRPGGRLAMVVPSEILHVLHAQSLRAFLGKTCSKILIIDPEELWFGETLQGVVLLLAEKKTSDTDREYGVAITQLRDRAFLTQSPGSYFDSADFSNGDMIAGKWMPALLTRQERDLLKDVARRPHVCRFDEIADVDVGIVTGANKFFLVTDEVVDRYGLERWAHPMFGRSEHAPGVIYDEATHKANREAGLPTNFLWFGTGKASTFPESVQEYIRMGESQGLNHRYKCRIRTPWYNVPSVYAAPVGMLKRCHDYPRLILNKVGAYTTDTAYRIRLNNIRAERFVYSFVNSLTALTAELEGRHYGGGVLELVPSEIERLLIPTPSVPVLLDCLNREIRGGLSTERLFSMQNGALLQPLGLSKQNQGELFNAWNRLRMRRQRSRSKEELAAAILSQ